MPEPTIRAAEARDLPAIADIYNAAILSSVATFDTEPWTPARCDEWLKEHAHPYAALVAESDGELLGWGSLSLYRAKPAYRYSAEDSVYVRDGRQQAGVGAALLARLIEVARENGFRTVVARITAPNPASVRLHERLGFVHVGVERDVGYKFERWLDVVVMQAFLGG
jgi:L-amino acid N-acyltransferase YncA